MLRKTIMSALLCTLVFSNENTTIDEKAYSVSEMYIKDQYEKIPGYIVSISKENLFASIMDSAIDNTDFSSDIEESTIAFLLAFFPDEIDKMNKDAFYKHSKIKEMEKFDFKTEIKQNIQKLLGLGTQPSTNQKYYKRECNMANPEDYDFDKEIYFIRTNKDSLINFLNYSDYLDEKYGSHQYYESSTKRNKITRISEVKIPSIAINFDNSPARDQKGLGNAPAPTNGFYVKMNIDLAKKVLNSRNLPYGGKFICVYTEYEIPNITQNWFIESLNYILVGYVENGDYIIKRNQNGEIMADHLTSYKKAYDVVSLNGHITRIEIVSAEYDREIKDYKNIPLLEMKF